MGNLIGWFPFPPVPIRTPWREFCGKKWEETVLQAIDFADS